MTNGRDRTRIRGNELRQFERNRFFHGKLMTARDMQAEQDYHIGRLHTFGRLLAGTGILRGLAVTDVTDSDDGLEVTIEPGVAVDGGGNLIVVEDTVTRSLPSPPDETISLFLAYDEASKDRVPIPGSETSHYDQDCTYNRIVETFDVYHRPDSPDSFKAVPPIEFPDRSDGDDESALLELARSYHREHPEPRGTADEIDVFLGSFERRSDGWTETDETDRRPYVYTNDMLYAALVRHVTDFENPHGIEITGERPPESPDTGAIDELDRELERIKERLDDVEEQKSSLERYVMNDSLETKLSAFRYVHTEFVSGTAEEIVEQTKKALQGGIDEREEYLEFIGNLLEKENALKFELDDEATDESLRRYSEVLADLEQALAELSNEESVVDIAVAQKQVCNAAISLESS